MTVISFGQGAPSTILGGVIELVHAGMLPVALLVFFASILVPVLKLIGLVFLLVSIQLGWSARLARPDAALPDHRGHRPLVDGRRVHDRDPGRPGRPGQPRDDHAPAPAPIAFCGVVIVTMLAAMSFDPRLMWDVANERRNEPPPAPRLSRPMAAVKRRSGISIVWVIPLVAAAIGPSSPTRPTRAGPDDHHQLRHRRGARGRQDQAALPRRRGRHRARTSPSPPTCKHIVVTAGMVPNAADFLRTGHDVLDRQAARRRGRRLRPRHAALGRLHRPRARRGRDRPDVHRPGGAAADQLQRARPRVRADRADAWARSAPARRSTTAASRSARCWATSSTPTRAASTSRSSSRSRSTSWCAPTSRFWNASGIDVATGASGIEVHDRLAAGAAHRRDRVRHARRPAKARAAAAAGTRFPLYREPARAGAGAVHREGPLSWSTSTAPSAASAPGPRSSSAASRSAR